MRRRRRRRSRYDGGLYLAGCNGRCRGSHADGAIAERLSRCSSTRARSARSARAGARVQGRRRLDAVRAVLVRHAAAARRRAHGDRPRARTRRRRAALGPLNKLTVLTTRPPSSLRRPRPCPALRTTASRSARRRLLVRDRRVEHRSRACAACARTRSRRARRGRVATAERRDCSPRSARRRDGAGKARGQGAATAVVDQRRVRSRRRQALLERRSARGGASGAGCARRLELCLLPVCASRT